MQPNSFLSGGVTEHGDDGLLKPLVDPALYVCLHSSSLRSQMSLPACASEKSYRTGMTPVLSPTPPRLSKRGPLW